MPGMIAEQYRYQVVVLFQVLLRTYQVKGIDTVPVFVVPQYYVYANAPPPPASWSLLTPPPPPPDPLNPLSLQLLQRKVRGQSM